MWIILTVASAFFLGIYDIMKKLSLNGNAVLPVLLVSSCAGAFVFIFPLALSNTGAIPDTSIFYVPDISLETHLMILLKTIIVLASWIFGFFGLKHLPITMVTPIRSTSPLWTLIGALLIFSEKLTVTQWLGLAVTLVFFYLFSNTGKLEGITFRNNKYMWFIVLATLIGAASSLYDKFLMQRIHPMAVQTYFSFYQVALLLPVVMLLWWPKREQYTPFKFHWAIPMIGLSLAAADFLYFYALSIPDSLISVISAVRRSNVVVAFGIGAFLFREQNIFKKALFLLGILGGVMILLFG